MLACIHQIERFQNDSKSFPASEAVCDGQVSHEWDHGGTPETLLNALAGGGPDQLTIASLTTGIDSFGLRRLYESRKVKRMIGSYVGENKNFEHMFVTGKLEVELVPQGTIGGIPLKYAKDGSVEIVTEPRPTKVLRGRSMLWSMH